MRVFIAEYLYRSLNKVTALIYQSHQNNLILFFINPAL